MRFGTSEPAVGLAKREQQVGRKFDTFHDYSGGGFTVKPVKHPDHHLLETIASGTGTSHTWVQDCLAGRLDAAIKAKRDSVKVATTWAIWQEMNGHWMSTNGSKIGGAANFAKAFRRAALIIRGNPLIEIGWAPNVYGFPGSVAEDPLLYYPGADVVDLVIPDGYDHNTYTDFGMLFAPVIAHYGPNGTRHKHKIVIGETSAQGTLQPDKYWASVHAWLLAHPGQVSEVNAFDNPYNLPGKPPNNYNVDYTPTSLAAYKALVTDPKLLAA